MAVLNPTEFNYVTVAPSTSFTQMSFRKPAGQGDFLNHLIVNVSTAATSTVSIRDGNTGGGFALVSANTPIGVYYLPIQCVSISAGGWGIQTGAGASVWVSGYSTDK